MSDHDTVDLAITIRPAGNTYVADAHLAQPGSQADSVLATDVSVAFDPRRTPVAEPRPHRLRQSAQTDPRLREAWQPARRSQS